MQEDSDYHPTGRVLTGRMVLAILVGFFGVMLAVNFIFASYAVKTFSGLDADNPYDSGLAYNQEIAAAKAQQALDWTVQIDHETGGDAVQFNVTVKDRDGAPVTGLDAELNFYFPATRKLDHHITAPEIAGGVYSGAAPLSKGHWVVELDLKRAGTRQFRSHNSFDVD